jgi:hypothetical protein
MSTRNLFQSLGYPQGSEHTKRLKAMDSCNVFPLVALDALN